MGVLFNPFTNRLQIKATGGGGTGDVTGPGSSTDNALVRWDGTTGTMIQNGIVTETDTGELLGPNGTSAAPTYSFTGSPNSGMFTNGTNTFISGNGSPTLSVGFNVSIDGNTTTISKGFVKSGIVTKNTTFTTDYDEYMYVVDTTGAAFTAQLLNSPLAGQEYIFKDNTGTWATNNFTISGVTSGILIDGLTTFVGNVNGASITLIYNGVQWNVI